MKSKKNKWLGIKISHDELMALPEADQFDYFDAHGGVFAVMGQNGFGLTDDDVEAWMKEQEEDDREWEIEYYRRYDKKINN